MASFEEIKHAPIEATIAGADNTIVAAVAGKRIRVLAWTLVMAGTAPVSARWKSGAAPNLSGAMPFAPNGGMSAAVSVSQRGPAFLFQTLAGQALVLNVQGTGAQAHGVVTYQEA